MRNYEGYESTVLVADEIATLVGCLTPRSTFKLSLKVDTSDDTS